MRYLLVLLVGLTVGCGVAASVTVSMATAYPGAGERGYESAWVQAR